MDLLPGFRRFIGDYDLCRSGERVLLAVSGGIDSMSMAHLALQAEMTVGVAHCNFRLRGEASDADEAFVRAWAEQRGAPFYRTEFSTRDEAGRRGVSIQMAARELRYEWLEALRRREGYHWIATGHHLGDSIETILFNFAKGTGIRGLHGIPLKRERIIRPLLFATRPEILAYAEEQGIAFREDQSNEEDDYTRNRIRRRLIPFFLQLNPAFETIAAENIQRFREAEYLFDWALERIRREVCSQEGDRFLVNIERLLLYYPAAPTILFEFLRPFEFNARQVRQILESAGRQPGARFFSAGHQLLVDRESLIVEARRFDSEPAMYYIAEQTQTIYLTDGMLAMEWNEGRPDIFPSDPSQAVLNADALHFPLCLRHWQAGDYFYPLGLQGRRQKLQDFFSNNKISRLDKANIWLLVNGDGNICWVVGYQPDERFRVAGQTNRYLHATFRRL